MPKDWLDHALQRWTDEGCDVEAHGVPWRPASWLDKWTRESLPGRDAIESLSNGRPNPVLTRREVFARYPEAGQDCLPFLIAVLIFGWQSPRRYVPATVRSHQAARAVADACHRGGASAGWHALWPRTRQSSVPGLGVAYGTKLLYFATPRSALEGQRGGAPPALIYDRRVMQGLRRLNFTSCPSPDERTITWVDHYGPYVDFCVTRGDRCGVRADVVEYLLWCHGRGLDPFPCP